MQCTQVCHIKGGIGPKMHVRLFALASLILTFKKLSNEYGEFPVPVMDNGPQRKANTSNAGLHLA
jgi:hypothetical protein